MLICRNVFIKSTIVSPFRVNEDVISESTQVKLYIDHNIIFTDMEDDLDIMRQRLQLYVQGTVLVGLRRFHIYLLSRGKN